MEESALMWYGYKHVNSSVHLKRFFGHEDIIECRESDFVANVYGPFEAENRVKALSKLEKVLRRTHEKAIS